MLSLGLSWTMTSSPFAHGRRRQAVSLSRSVAHRAPARTVRGCGVRLCLAASLRYRGRDPAPVRRRARWAGMVQAARGREAAGRLAWADAYTGVVDGRQVVVLGRGGPGVAGDCGVPPRPCRRLPGRAPARVSAPCRARRAGERCDARSGWPSTWQQGELAQAGGWLARANRLLEHEQECAERAYLLIPVALQHLVAGDTRGAGDSATAADIGRRSAKPTGCARARPPRPRHIEGGPGGRGTGVAGRGDGGGRGRRASPPVAATCTAR